MILRIPVVAWVLWRAWKDRGPLTYPELVRRAGPSLYWRLNERCALDSTPP